MRLLIILLFLTFAAAGAAQQDLTEEYVESKTFEYFENGQWSKLIRLGERALNAGMESYLIRMRTGIAFYELEDYAGAIPHLRKAVNTGYAEGFVKEYLYYSYLFMGRKEDAADVYFDMSESRQKKIRPLINDFIDDLDVTAGYSFSSDESDNGGIDIDGTDNAYGEQTVNNGQFYFDVALAQLPLRWMKISYAFSYLNISRQKQIMFNDVRVSDDYKQKQGQLYNEFDFRISEGFVVKPSGHYINSKETSLFARYDSATLVYNSSTLSYDPDEFYYTLYDSTLEQDNFVLSLTAYKWLSRFRFGAAGSFSYLNGKHQTQYGVSAIAFPLKSNKLYAGADITLHNQDGVANLIFSPVAGGRITDELWCGLFASFGRMNNYNERNGFYVYNNPDVITLKYGAELKYYFRFNLTAGITYVGQNRERRYLTYMQTGSVNGVPVFGPVFPEVSYNQNSFLLGLNYIF